MKSKMPRCTIIPGTVPTEREAPPLPFSFADPPTLTSSSLSSTSGLCSECFASPATRLSTARLPASPWSARAWSLRTPPLTERWTDSDEGAVGAGGLLFARAIEGLANARVRPLVATLAAAGAHDSMVLVHRRRHNAARTPHGGAPEKRTMGLEPTTPGLGSQCSTN